MYGWAGGGERDVLGELRRWQVEVKVGGVKISGRVSGLVAEPVG